MADYRDAVSYPSETAAQEAKESGESSGQARWWAEELTTDAEELEEIASLAISMAKSLEQNSQERRQANLRHARLYENVEIDALGANDFATSVVSQALRGRGFMSRNVVAACEDTLAAKIAKNKPRPTFLTSGGSWDKQQKARRLDRFARGLFYELDLYEVGKDVFYDGETYGTGFLHLFRGRKGRLQAERVVPDEMFVDDLDGLYGHPRIIMRRKFIHREVVKSMFPKADLSGAKSPFVLPIKGSQANMLEVWEGWHIPSGPKEKDGRHIIFTDKCCLVWEAYELDVFPFVPFRYKKRTVGYWGKGVAETLAGIQVELNRSLSSISEQIRRKGKGRTYIPMGSKIAPAHMTNGIGDLVYFTGAQAPVHDSGNVVSNEEIQYAEFLYRAAFQEVGVSELSVAAKKPSGLDAAVALREYSDIESERFALTHQSWDNFFMDVIKLALKLIRDFGAKGYKVRLPNKRYAIEMDWADIGLEEEDYTIQIFPSSALPTTPAYRLQTINEMEASGRIDKATATRLLDFPDLEEETNLMNAALDDVDATISAVLDDEKPTLRPVEPFQNLDMMITRASAAYLFARNHGAEDERLDMLQQLIEQATQQKVLLMTPPPAPPPGPPAPDAMPMAGPPPPSGPPITNTNTNTVNMPVPPTVPPVVQ